jgi:hypothetical protein
MRALNHAKMDQFISPVVYYLLDILHHGVPSEEGSKVNSLSGSFKILNREL